MFLGNWKASCSSGFFFWGWGGMGGFHLVDFVFSCFQSHPENSDVQRGRETCVCFVQ